MVNPGRIRDFARSEGVRSKTDPIDAKMILAFAKSKALQPMEGPSDASIKLAALLDRRGHLVEQMAREKNRLQNSEDFIHRSIKRMIRVLEKEIAAIEKSINQLVASDPGLQARTAIIESVKGVGPVTAWTLLAYLSEIEDLSRNSAVPWPESLPSIAIAASSPANEPSRAAVQKSASASIWPHIPPPPCNPVIVPYVQGLRDRGKPYKSAIVAAMRKLLIHIQSLLKSAQLSPC